MSDTDTPIEWKFKHFSTLNCDELYSLLKLRAEVFIVEQNCAYLDLDNFDQEAWHLCGRPRDSQTLGAYARILKPGSRYQEPSIGRVITSTTMRRTGLGKLLMQESIKELLNLYPQSPIRISAQQYLERFYSSFGFHKVSEPYLEDNIWHIEMLR